MSIPGSPPSSPDSSSHYPISRSLFSAPDLSRSSSSPGNLSYVNENAPETETTGPATELSKAGKTARKELEDDFNVSQGKNLGEAEQLKLKCNWKMAAGIALGVVVGVVVLAIVLAALGASHGAAIPLLIPLAKASAALLSHLGISSAIGGLTSLGVSATVAEIGLSVAILFGGGGVFAKIFRGGEQKSLRELLPSSDNALKELQGDKRLDIGEVEDYMRYEQSTITSSQAGRNFIDMGRRFKLQSTATKILGFFGYFWSAIPGVATRSLGSDQAQYSKRMEHYDREVDLKKASAGDLEALKKLKFLPEDAEAKQKALTALNNLRDIQIRQLVSKNSAASKAYAEAPEILAIDMNLAELRLLLTRPDTANKGHIRGRIEIEEEKKSQLVDARMKKSIEETPERSGIAAMVLGSKQKEQAKLSAIFSSNPDSPIRSLFSISRDIDTLKGLDGKPLDEEQKGQLLEATAVYLEKHPDATIEDVNHLVNVLKGKLSNSRPDEWQTREGVIAFAQQFPVFSTMKAEQKTPALETWTEQAKRIKASVNQAPMSIGRVALLAKQNLGLRVLDIAIVAAHALPGGTALSVAPSLAAIAVEKGAVPSLGQSHTFEWVPSQELRPLEILGFTNAPA